MGQWGVQNWDKLTVLQGAMGEASFLALSCEECPEPTVHLSRASQLSFLQ